MSKTARLYSDTRTASAAADAAPSNLDKLNGELQDVTRIMTKNMEELLWRGDSLDREFLSCLSFPAFRLPWYIRMHTVLFRCYLRTAPLMAGIVP